MRPLLSIQPPIVRFLAAQRSSCCRLCSFQTASWYSNSTNRWAVAVTKSPHKLATPSRPTKRDKIQSRAGQISQHLQHSTTSTTTSKSATTNMAEYTTRRIGAPNTLEHRIFIEQNGKPISPFHDIPLYANPEQTILNMIVEVPRWTNAKMEVRQHPQIDISIMHAEDLSQCTL
jgi:hypothetical protein